MPFSQLQFYQIAIVLISLIMIYFGLEKFLRREATQSLLKLSIRLIVWGSMGVLALFPELSNIAASFMGIEGNINAVIFTGFLLVFLLIFKILSVVERIEQDISTLTRKDAIQNALPITNLTSPPPQVTKPWSITHHPLNRETAQKSVSTPSDSPPRHPQ